MARPKGSLNKSTIERQARAARLDTVPAAHNDSWQNFFAGIGMSSRDKTMHTEYGSFTELDDETLTQIYMGDGLGSRIIDCVADDMTREWVYLPDDSAREVFERETMRLGAETKFNEALRWQRLYGGGLIYLGAMDGGRPEAPLNVAKIKSLEYLNVFAKTDVSISESRWDTNPNSPTYGKITQYMLRDHINGVTNSRLVHHTRVIPFFNDPIPPKLRISTNADTRYWGRSSLQPIYESLRDLGGINQSVANILYEFIIGKYSFPYLNEMLAEGKESQLIRRIEIMNMSKSTINGILLGEGETYTRDYATLAGLPEVIDRFMLALSGSTGIPVTRLFGRSPAGLNATGENDLRNYYDLIQATQRNKLRYPLHQFMSALFKTPTPPKFEFNSLYQMTEKEKAECAQLEAEAKAQTAQAYNTYILAQVLSAEEVRKELGKDDEEIDYE
jgi:phage-related protein (TIGR01555 family)